MDGVSYRSATFYAKHNENLEIKYVWYTVYTNMLLHGVLLKS